MGSFRLAAGRLHHHKHFNFAESREETVWPSLRHSCRSELTRQGISLPRTVIVTAAVYRGFDQELAPHHLTFRHRAGVTPYTSTFVFAECCVFNKQSQPPILCDPIMLGAQAPHTTGAYLLPKLRYQFAEFLLPSSLKRLGIFIPSTCVGLRYGLVQLKLRGFSWNHFQSLRETCSLAPHP